MQPFILKLRSNVMFPKLCAADFFKVLDIYTSFQPKLSKCCHEVMIDNVGDCAMLLEKMVISKENKKVVTFLAVTCNATRDQRWLTRKRSSPSALTEYKSIQTKN